MLTTMLLFEANNIVYYKLLRYHTSNKYCLFEKRLTFNS